MKTFLALFIFLLLVRPTYAVTPMDYFISLVAGDDDAGFQDGAFIDARFNHPCGLVFDNEGKRLFVADTRNNRIRVIYLDEDHRVETVAGPGEAQQEEGSWDKASVQAPQNLVYLPGDCLLVYGGADQYLKWINLKDKTVHLLTKGLGSIWSMAYCPQDNALYLTDPEQGRLDRFDVKTGQLSIVLENSKKLKFPLALCVHEGKLFVSDMKTSAVYGFEITKGASGTEFQTLTKMGQGSNIVEMAFTAGSLYALQTGSTSLAVIWPQPRNVSLTSAWDFQLSNSNQSYLPLLKSPSGQPVGFAVSPREADRFFIAQPRSNLHCVISVKDDHFSEYWFSRDPAGPIRQLTDFEYPASKPPQTFRILVVGTSRVVTAPTAMTDEGPKKNSASMDNYDFHSLRLHTFAKRLEFLLNTQAALDGVSQHFQVLELGRPGAKLSFFVNRQVPPLVKKYDVDMVLALLAPTFEEGFSNYFTSPLNDEGIPGEADPEYLLKPWKDRVPSGAPQQLLEKCFKLHLVQEDKNQQLKFAFFQDLLNQGRSDVRNDLLEMLGKPLQVLDQHLKNMKVASTGRQAQLKFFFVPDPDCDNLENYRAFWSDLCTQKGLDLLDLTQPYEDLKYSYYPVTEACCHQHYTAYGNELIAQLLLHYLPQKGWVPLGPAYQGK